MSSGEKPTTSATSRQVRRYSVDHSASSFARLRLCCHGRGIKRHARGWHAPRLPRGKLPCAFDTARRRLVHVRVARTCSTEAPGRTSQHSSAPLLEAALCCDQPALLLAEQRVAVGVAAVGERAQRAQRRHHLANAHGTRVWADEPADGERRRGGGGGASAEEDAAREGVELRRREHLQAAGGWIPRYPRAASARAACRKRPLGGTLPRGYLEAVQQPESAASSGRPRRSRGCPPHTGAELRQLGLTCNTLVTW